VFKIDSVAIFKALSKRKPKKVMLQFPEGLKPQAFQIAQEIKDKTGIRCVLSGDPCYGGCDVDSATASSLNIDLILHFGHTEYPLYDPYGIPVVYIPVRDEISFIPIIQKLIPLLPENGCIGLVTTTQYIESIEVARNSLENANFAVKVGEGCAKTPEPGQVLGCEFCNSEQIAEKCDVIVFLGTGLFHPLGIALATNKPVLAADPVKNEITPLEKMAKQTLAVRVAQMQRFKSAQKVAVILGVKLGQMNTGEANKALMLLNKHGRQAFLVTLREINALQLLNFPEAEGFVVCACPRVVIEDGPTFPKPTITTQELEVALGVRELSSVYSTN
jgi:2-(3-amino-3-carboxypropyl)histidine synthase